MRQLIMMCTLMLLSLGAEARDWLVNKTESVMTFEGTHIGNPFTLKFGTYKVNLNFDMDRLADSQLALSLDVSTAKTGDFLYDSTLPQEEWLDVANHPTIQFASTRLFKEGDAYAAEGIITLKGKSYPVTVPFTVSMSGDHAVAEGSFTLDRVAMNIGVVSDPAATWVSREIVMTFKIVADVQG